MRLIVARCEVTYTGRLTAYLPESTRLLMVKADGSALVQGAPARDARASSDRATRYRRASCARDIDVGCAATPCNKDFEVLGAD